MVSELRKSLEDIIIATEKSPLKRSGTIWVPNKVCKLAFRATIHNCNGMAPTIDIASIEVKRKGKGIFKNSILPMIESLAISHNRAVYVECVQEERFQKFFENLGYIKIEASPPSYYRSSFDLFTERGI